MTASPRPRVSVVIAARNEEARIGAAIRSVLAQTLEELELLVVDDQSTDATADVVERIARGDPRVRLLRNERWLERSASRNRAIREASSDLIAILDADDVALPDRLRQQVEFMDAHPRIGLLGTWAYELDMEGKPLALLVSPADDARLRDQLRWRNPWGNPFIHPSVLYRKELAEQAGLYDEDMTVGEDKELFWRMLQHGTCAVIKEPLVLRRVDWKKERRQSRFRRRMAWHWSRRFDAGSPAGLAILCAATLRLAIPSSVDVGLRRLKRWFSASPALSPDIIRWLEWCEEEDASE